MELAVTVLLAELAIVKLVTGLAMLSIVPLVALQLLKVYPDCTAAFMVALLVVLLYALMKPFTTVTLLLLDWLTMSVPVVLPLILPPVMENIPVAPEY